MSQDSNAQCECGQVQFRVGGQPLMRGFCHCSICQAYNNKPFADITVFRARDVVMPDEGAVKYRAWRKPPMVRRGQCVVCGGPAVETLHIPPMPRMVIVPTANLRDETLIPEPALHIFYDRRVEDANDALPRYRGYLRSQIGFGTCLMKSLISRAR